LSVTISVRVPEGIKRRLEELRVDISKEVRGHLERVIEREEGIARLREAEEAMRKARVRVPGGTSAALVREGRDRGR